MITLKKLFSNNNLFDEVIFRPGINIISGERVDSKTIAGRKTNGVGKTLCIEFLNFAFLKKERDSRVTKIPKSQFPSDTEICLDFILNQEEITIKRRITDPKKPIIERNGTLQQFNSCEDAGMYLMELMYPNRVSNIKPSFRELMGPIIRDERSEFNDIIQCYPQNKGRSIPRNYNPHLFFFQIDLTTYKNSKNKINEIKSEKEYIRKLKKELTGENYSKISDVKSELNQLKDELQTIKGSIELLKSNESFDSIQKDIITIEDQLEILRARQKSLKYELNKIKQLPEPEEIDNKDIELLYNKFKDGLGNQIVKSLEQVQVFKDRIEKFQGVVLNERAKKITAELQPLNERIIALDENHASKLKLIDNKGILRNLKSSLNIFSEKNDEYSKIKSLYENFEKANNKKNVLVAEKDKLIVELDTIKVELRDEIENFNQTILDIHEKIMGNNRASFQMQIINNNSSKEVISFEMRIDSDGSHSVDREKVFIYDIALLTNPHTRKNHPKFLIHDNIFEVDQDTLFRSLNYLEALSKKPDFFQYIVTINRDKLETTETLNHLDFNIDNYVVASYTKENKFLKKNYQEQ